MQPPAPMALDQGLQSRPPLTQGQASQIRRAVRQQVIGDHRRRKGRHGPGVHRLAVQPLLQVAEGGDGAVAPDHQFAVQRALERQGLHHIGEGARNLVPGAGPQFADRALDHRLNPDAVPLPFGGVVGRVHLGKIDRLVDSDSQHHRAEPPWRIRAGPFGPSLQPGEQIAIGGRDRVPDLLDGRDVHRLKRRNRLRPVR